MGKIDLLEELYNKLLSGAWIVLIDISYPDGEEYWSINYQPSVYMSIDKQHWFYPYFDALTEYAFYESKDDIGIDIEEAMFDYCYDVLIEGRNWRKQLIAYHNPVPSWDGIRHEYKMKVDK